MNQETEIEITEPEYASLTERLGKGATYVMASATRPGGKVRGVGRKGASHYVAIELGPTPTTMTASTPPVSKATTGNQETIEKLRGSAAGASSAQTAILAKAVQAHAGKKMTFVEALRIVSERKGNTL